MSKVLTILLMIVLLTGNDSPVNAAVIKKPLTIKSDSSRVEARQFDQSALNQYKAQKDFQYGTDYQTALSLWQRFWRWFWNYFAGLVSDAASTSVTKIISVLVLTGIIIYLIIKFSGVGVLQLFTGRAKPVPIAYSESLENIHEIDFEPEIEKAIHNGDYRLAVRMLYLKCLKKLSDNGFIAWQIDKTNTTYIAELANSGRKEKFTSLTRQFEYIWYGEFSINQSAFAQIEDDFKNFDKGL